VAAAFFPLAEAARRVGGDAVEVLDLTPAGAEPHDLEVGTREVEAIEDADLTIVLGGGFQPGLEEIAEGRGALVVLDEIDTSGGPKDDPHVWLDPTLMVEIADLVESRLIEADPDGADTYRANGEAFRDSLGELHGAFQETLANCERRLMVTAHEAFGWLAARYDLDQRAIAGVSPEQEPDPRRLAELAELVEKNGVTTVFTEALVSPEVAQALAREAGVETAVLDPLEGQEEGTGGESGYEAGMRANLEALSDALDCRP
jgi:zinc transport system substrate-binding protein